MQRLATPAYRQKVFELLKGYEENYGVRVVHAVLVPPTETGYSGNGQPEEDLQLRIAFLRAQDAYLGALPEPPKVWQMMPPATVTDSAADGTTKDTTYKTRMVSADVASTFASIMRNNHNDRISATDAVPMVAAYIDTAVGEPLVRSEWMVITGRAMAQAGPQAVASARAYIQAGLANAAEHFESIPGVSRIAAPGWDEEPMAVREPTALDLAFYKRAMLLIAMDRSMATGVLPDVTELSIPTEVTGGQPLKVSDVLAASAPKAPHIILSLIHKHFETVPNAREAQVDYDFGKAFGADAEVPAVRSGPSAARVFLRQIHAHLLQDNKFGQPSLTNLNPAELRDAYVDAGNVYALGAPRVAERAPAPAPQQDALASTAFGMPS